MCGICGYIDYKGNIEDRVLENMVHSIRHRGPDDNGLVYFKTPYAKVGLGHARLSILDLTKAGQQPMQFENLTIVFNGEIYNFKEIRQELLSKGHQFVSNSDTEVILHSFKEWHTDCVNRFIGMFAFAIYNQSEQKLFLCRDRAGVKPLYYHVNENFVSFASELKPLMLIPSFERLISMESVSAFLKVGYIPGEMSIFEKTYKLDGGCWAEYDIKKHLIKKWNYWNIEEYYNKPKLNVSYENAKKEIKELFKSAFGYRLVSDVPVGVLLSGGFDSATVTAILSKELGVIPRTFTIGFHDYIDEAPDAEKISALLGTQHTTYYCTVKDIVDLVPQLPIVYDEPFADPSALPSILVSMIVRKDVPVVLSADGGDEIFGGYDRYEYFSKKHPVLNHLPKLLRYYMNGPLRTIASLLPDNMMKPKGYIGRIAETLLSEKMNQKAWYDNMYYSKEILINDIFPQFQRYDSKSIFHDIKTASNTNEYALIADYKTKMKDEFLIKVDRAMMSVSLEGREPLLDHRISEYVAQLPWEYKYHEGHKKRILKDIAYDYLPQNLMDKPKRGFTPPICNWMRNELREYVYSQIDALSLLDINVNKKSLNKMLVSFMNGNDCYSECIWALTQYGAWAYKYVLN